jgi:hypothetical protein
MSFLLNTSVTAFCRPKLRSVDCYFLILDKPRWNSIRDLFFAFFSAVVISLWGKLFWLFCSALWSFFAWKPILGISFLFSGFFFVFFILIDVFRLALLYYFPLVQMNPISFSLSNSQEIAHSIWWKGPCNNFPFNRLKNGRVAPMIPFIFAQTLSILPNQIRRMKLQVDCQLVNQNISNSD